MAGRYLLQAHGSFPIDVAGYEFQARAGRRGRFVQPPEVGFVRRHLGVKSCHVAFQTDGRQEGFDFDIRHFHHLTGFAGQNQDFAGHVAAAQVEAGVGLGVALGLGLAYHLGKRSGTVIVIEHEIERARENGLHAPHHVATADEVIERTDNGQGRAHVSFKQVTGVELLR